MYWCIIFHRMIANLTSRLEGIEVDMKQSRRVSVASRPSGDNGKPEMTPRHHRRWTASSDQRRWSSESVISLPDSQRGSFTWQMPFTLKCIGTFRLIISCVLNIFWLPLLIKSVKEPINVDSLNVSTENLSCFSTLQQFCANLYQL